MFDSAVSTFRRLAALGVLVLLLGGCGSEQTEERSGWIVDDRALALERTLVAGDGEDYFFGEITDVAVRSDGRMYVADGDAHHIKVIGTDGALVDSIGRQGEGPGEFDRPAALAVARGDSLYVLDPFAATISVFTPDDRFARSTSASLGLRADLLVPPDAPGLGYARIVPFPGPSEPGYVVSGLGRETADTILAGQRAETYTPAGTNTSYPIPYSPHSFVSMGPDGLVHFVRGDSLTVARYDFRGRRRGVVRVPFEPVPVSEADRDRVMEELSESRPISEGRFPEMKAAAEDFFVDDEGRYWFGRPTANADSTDWWVAWPEEKRVATGTLPSDVQLKVVKDGRAYGRSETGAGAPVVVRYRIDIRE